MRRVIERLRADARRWAERAEEHDARGEEKMARICREGAAVNTADADRIEARYTS